MTPRADPGSLEEHLPRRPSPTGTITAARSSAPMVTCILPSRRRVATILRTVKTYRPCWAKCCGSCQRRRGPKEHAVPADNPFANVGGAGSLCKQACGTFGGCRSIARRTSCGAGRRARHMEEVDIIDRGGNYGWNIREGFIRSPRAAPRWPCPKSPSSELLEPLYEYHQPVGKSITGGHVYRGKEVPSSRHISSPTMWIARCMPCVTTSGKGKSRRSRRSAQAAAGLLCRG